MHIEYHWKNLFDDEKNQVKNLVENHMNAFQFADRHSQKKGEGQKILIKCTISKTQEQPEHCKYTVNLHTTPALKNSAQVIQKEGFDLASLVKESFEALRHLLEHRIEKEKNPHKHRRHTGHNPRS